MASFCSLFGFFSSLLFLSKYRSKVFLRRSNRFWTTKNLIPRSKLVCWLAKVVESAITINKNGFSSSPFAKTVLLNYSMKVWIDGALFLVVFSSGIISDFVPKVGMFLGWTREKINSSSDFLLDFLTQTSLKPSAKVFPTNYPSRRFCPKWVFLVKFLCFMFK